MYAIFVGQFTGVCELEGHERGALRCLAEARPATTESIAVMVERSRKRRIRARLAHKTR